MRAKISKLFTKPHANQSAAAADSTRARSNDIMRPEKKRCQQIVLNATAPCGRRIHSTQPREKERDHLQCAPKKNRATTAAAFAPCALYCMTSISAEPLLW